MSMEKRRSKPPRIALPRRRGDWILEAVASLSLLVLLLIVVFSWRLIPPRVPIHYGLSGVPDAWGPRSFLLLLPAVAVGLYALLTALSAVPHVYSYPWPITPDNAETQYRLARRMLLLLKNLLVLIFLVIYVKTWRTAVGTQAGLTALFLPSVLLSVSGVVGWYLLAAKRATTTTSHR